MKKIDPQVFITSGAKGGSAKGPQKRRSDEFYQRLAAASVAARKAKKEAKNARK
jgi:hypothetical protein